METRNLQQHPGESERQGWIHLAIGLLACVTGVAVSLVTGSMLESMLVDESTIAVIQPAIDKVTRDRYIAQLRTALAEPAKFEAEQAAKSTE